MTFAIEYLDEQLSHIRAGKANPKILDCVRVMYYGAPVPLTNVATVTVPDARTIIDIGGQDAKAIRLDHKGNILKFVMNDKCAAGTGRFLDVMSRVLEIGLQEMGDAHFKADCPANVSSTCTVFAESEVISQLSKGVSKENIAAGVHRSIASKACSLVYRVGMEEKVVMCGGVAQDKGVVDAIEQELKKKILVADNPQTTGALGAALIAFELAGKSS